MRFRSTFDFTENGDFVQTKSGKRTRKNGTSRSAALGGWPALRGGAIEAWPWSLNRPSKPMPAGRPLWCSGGARIPPAETAISAVAAAVEGGQNQSWQVDPIVHKNVRHCVFNRLSVLA
jgi:hypothetical protein